MREYLSVFLAKTKQLAFTLPEIVTAVTVGGVISVLVLNTAVKEITTQTMNTQRVLANNEIAVAAADLQAEDALTGNKSQEEFNEKFKKVLSFKEIKEDEISNKFASQYTDSNGKTFSPNDYKNKVVTSSGVSFAYTYDTTCSTNYQFSQSGSAKVGNNYAAAVKNEALKCIKGFIDINGTKGPNEYGKDVMFLTSFNKDCYDKNGNLTNFIPNAYGNCPDDKDKNKEDTLTPAQNVCSLTELNCKANGSLKTLDRNSCECVCRISCPKGSTLNKETCSCSCDTNKIETTICKRSDKSENPYADCSASKQACTCMPKNPNAPEICKKNGGEWNSTTCSCSCPTEVKNRIKKEYYNLAKADENNYCTPKCIYSVKSEQFKEQIRKNAQEAGLDDAKIIEITDVSSVEDKCFACATASASNMEYTKNDKGEHGGFCSNGCSDSVKKSTAYDTNYFTFNDYNQNDLENSCKWTCKTGDNEGIKKLVKELNANPSYTSPKILNAGDGSDNLENFKLAQYHYFEAAALGKSREENNGINTIYDLVINNKTYRAQYPYNCEDRGCGATYKAFKDNDSVFAGFLKYAASSDTAPEYAFGWLNGTSADTYKIHYTANTTNCSVETTGFNFGTSPTSQIPYHSAGVDRRKWEMVTFGFEPIKNTNLEIKNPNKNIKAPDAFKSYGGYSNYSDEYWKNIPIGVLISYKTQYDPLALNIGSNPNADPTVITPGTVAFPIEYVSSNNYRKVNVHWPNENSYRFIVNEDFKNNITKRHIGNMFSDQISSEGVQYSTGFDQLQAQYDGKQAGTIKDGIITRDEMTKLYLYRHNNAIDLSWNTMDHSFVPLTDFVLDINLYKVVVRDESGSGVQNDNIIYDIQGNYRRLINASYNKPTCPSGNFCMNYIGYNRNNIDNELKSYLKNEEGTKYIAELWQDMKDNNVYYYYLREKGGVLKDYPKDKDSWQKIVKTDVVETTGATLPNKVTKLENDIPDKISEKITTEQDATTTVYVDEDGIYYVVKETIIQEPENNQNEVSEDVKSEEDENKDENTASDNNNSVKPTEENNDNENTTEENNDENTSFAPSSTSSNIVNANNKNNETPNITPTNNEPKQETKKEVTKYELNKYSKGIITENDFKMYFKKGSYWYEVIIAKITDIIFKYEK